jgi:UDP-N-acetyl-D-glucosamine 4,6-dehydratase
MIKRVLFFLVFDFLISFGTLYFAYLLRFNFEIPENFQKNIVNIFLTIFTLKALFLFRYRVYYLIWRLVSIHDVLNIVKAHAMAYGIFIILVFLHIHYLVPIPKSVIIIDFFLSIGVISLFRMARRVYIENRITTTTNPTLIVGVDLQIDYIVKKCRKGELPYTPVAILDLRENSKRQSGYIHNIRIYGRESLPSVIRNYGIKSAIITKEVDSLNRIFDDLKKLGVSNVKVSSPLSNNISNISIEDLLARHPKDLDPEVIREAIKGKRVLITGAGGSIGSELSIQVRDFGAEEIYLVDHSEFNLYQIDDTLRSDKNRNYLINITNRERLREVFERNKIDLVLHSAAYKHVPLCEENIDSAVENNIVGSINVIDLAVEFGVPKVVIISTDKAVRPTNVMGTTKRVVELYAQNIDARETEIGAVRFGNVLGSSGSVIPKFKQLIEENRPITVTHPDITRYFMLISEACQLVLQAGTLAENGEIFILDMGEPVRIVDLANKMKRIYGKDDLPIEFVGLRAGEKKFEELLISDAEVKTEYESIFVTKPTEYKIEQLREDISKLLKAKGEEKLQILKRIVPEFSHNRGDG